MSGDAKQRFFPRPSPLASHNCQASHCVPFTEVFMDINGGLNYQPAGYTGLRWLQKEGSARLAPRRRAASWISVARIKSASLAPLWAETSVPHCQKTPFPGAKPVDGNAGFNMSQEAQSSHGFEASPHAAALWSHGLRGFASLWRQRRHVLKYTVEIKRA